MSTQESLLDRNVERIYPSKVALEKALKGGKKLKIYIGIDPSSPNIHLGNAIALRKLKQFQDAGHKIILLVGDFTGTIGDPSGHDNRRKPLERSEVLAMSKAYQEQAAKILNFSGENPAQVEYNSTWLSKLTLEQLMDLISQFTVSQLIERDLFQKRISEGNPIFLTEFLYPILQGYDCIALDVDMEVGGTDQTFNMLVGRDLMRRLRKKEKFVLTVPLLPGLDGRKMSKTFGNTVDINDDPVNMFGKIMSLKDPLIPIYFRFCTNLSEREVGQIEQGLKKKSAKPMEIKKRLAREIVSLYYNDKEAISAQKEFERVVQKGETPKPRLKKLNSELSQLAAVDVLLNLEMVPSKSEAKRLISQGGVWINGRKVSSTGQKFDIKAGSLARIGKLKAVSVEIDK